MPPNPNSFQPLAPTLLTCHLPTATPTADTPTAVPEPNITPFPNWRKPAIFRHQRLLLPGCASPVGRLKQPEGQINILLLGSDHRFNTAATSARHPYPGDH
jgi:hypothetical protein